MVSLNCKIVFHVLARQASALIRAFNLQPDYEQCSLPVYKMSSRDDFRDIRLQGLIDPHIDREFIEVLCLDRARENDVVTYLTSQNIKHHVYLTEDNELTPLLNVEED